MTPLNPGQILAERYRILRQIDRGGYGVVYEAEDLVAESRVAVKQVRPTTWIELRRTLREIAALRALRLPGIVPLLDDFSDNGMYFLVMALAEGEAFPGRKGPVSWSELMPVARRLLAALARVHAAGFVHRDMKPQNVLVARSGAVTILDFGLARRPDARDDVTSPGDVPGTAEYLAPETLNGETITWRTDLFSVGVMFYEALTGRLPWSGRTTVQLLQERMFADPTPIRQLVPEVPREVERVVMRLLLREPRERPASAAEVLVALDVGGTPSRMLPRLGADALIGEVTSRLLRGSVDVAGAPGMGRTRFCEAVALRLQEAGRPVVFLRHGARPFDSLVPVVGPLDELHGLSLLEAWTWVRSRVGHRLATGAVLMVDAPETLDRWSGQALDQLRTDGTILRIVEPANHAELRLAPLTEVDLRALFCGPDRILHLQTDAAAELHLRTGGIPARLLPEVEAWVSAGLATWQGDRLVVTREALFRLQAGHGRDLAVRPAPVVSTPLSDDLEILSGFVGLVRPAVSLAVLSMATDWSPWEVEVLAERLEAQGLARALPDGRVRDLSGGAAASRWSAERRAVASGRLARAMAPGTEGRLVCLLVAGRIADAVVEARLIARDQAAAGRIGEAMATIEQALTLGREDVHPEAERGLLEDLVGLALSTESARVLRRVAWELGRAQTPATDLADLVSASLSAVMGQGAEAEAAAEKLAPYTRPELELWRHGVRVQAAIRVGRGAEERVLADIAERAVMDLPGASTRYAGWLGALRFRQGRWAEAALHHAEEVRGELRLDERMTAMLNGASALVEAERFEAAEARAREALALAAPLRHGLGEARAELLLRTIAYRRGELPPADAELVEAVAALQSPELEGQVRLMEAVLAWRRGDEETASRLALVAATAFSEAGVVVGECLARAFSLGCGATVLPDQLALLEIVGHRTPLPLVGAQILSLLPTVGPGAPAVEELLRAVPDADPTTRREILSIKEMREGWGFVT